jgi:hypothetical protein
MCNYPINYCLRDNEDKEEILGIKSSFDTKDDIFKNAEVTNDSSLLEYVICITINSMNFIRDTVPLQNIDNTVKCNISKNPLTLDFIQESIKSSELRREWIKMGEEDANKFLHLKEPFVKIVP